MSILVTSEATYHTKFGKPIIGIPIIDIEVEKSQTEHLPSIFVIT